MNIVWHTGRPTTATMVATLSLVSYLMCALIMDTYNVVLIVQPADPFSFPIAVARPSAAATHLRAIPTGCGARTARRADWVGECADPNWANHIPTRQIGLKSTIPDRIKSSNNTHRLHRYFTAYHHCGISPTPPPPDGWFVG